MATNRIHLLQPILNLCIKNGGFKYKQNLINSANFIFKIENLLERLI